MKYFGYNYKHIATGNKHPWCQAFWVISTYNDHWYAVDNANRKILMVSDDEGATWSTVHTCTYDIYAVWYNTVDNNVYFVEQNLSSTVPASDPGCTICQIHYIETDNSDNVVDGGYFQLYTYSGSSGGVSEVYSEFIYYNSKVHLVHNFRCKKGGEADYNKPFFTVREWDGSTTWTQKSKTEISAIDGVGPVAIWTHSAWEDSNISWKMMCHVSSAYLQYLRVYEYNWSTHTCTQWAITGGDYQLSAYDALTVPFWDSWEVHYQSCIGIWYESGELFCATVRRELNTLSSMRIMKYNISGNSWSVHQNLPFRTKGYPYFQNIEYLGQKYGINGIDEIWVENETIDEWYVKTSIPLGSSDTVIATLNQFAISDTGKVFELIDLTDNTKNIEITYSRAPTTASILVDFNYTISQRIDLYNDAEELLFRGLVSDKNYDGNLRRYECISLDKEIISTKFSKDYSAKTAKEIIEDLITTFGSFISFDTGTIDTNFTTTYNISFINRTFTEAFDILMDLEDGYWYKEPNGRIHAYKFANLISSGKTVTQNSFHISSEVKIKEMLASINKIHLYGAITSGARLESTADDLTAQEVNGVIEYVDHFPHIVDQTTLDTLATAILNRTGIADNPIRINVTMQNLGFMQQGKTLNFQFTPYEELAVAADYLIQVLFYYPKEDNGAYVLSSGLVQEGREYEVDIHKTSDADEEQIDISAAEVKTQLATKQVNLPIGAIMMFSGTWVDNTTIPGWYKCDGANGTPNLVNQFIRGAATSGGSGGSNNAVVVDHHHSHTHTGGSHYHNAPQPQNIGGNDTWGQDDILTEFQYEPQNACENDEYASRTNSKNVGVLTTDHINAGVSGVNQNIPAYYALIFIMRIS